MAMSAEELSGVGATGAADAAGAAGASICGIPEPRTFLRLGFCPQ